MTIGTEDVEVVLGRAANSDIERSQWSVWIDDAVMLIEARLGPVAELDAVRVAYVVREAVLAQIRRPDDATTVDVSVDDSRVSKTYRTSAGRVTIRDEWWSLLAPTTGGQGAFSIRPSRGYCEHLPWCASMFAASYCSCGVDIAGEPIFEQFG